jgi:hypothetical protein
MTVDPILIQFQWILGIVSYYINLKTFVFGFSISRKVKIWAQIEVVPISTPEMVNNPIDWAQASGFSPENVVRVQLRNVVLN